MKLLFTILILLLGAVSASAQRPQWGQTIIDDSAATERRELLLTHGINPDAASLVRFLREGFPPASMQNHPEQPLLKSAVVDAAIAELGLTAEESAVPILIEIAARRLPQGIERIIRRDFEQSPVEIIDSEMQKMRRVLSLNAVVALGLIGNQEAEPTILDLMRTETGTAFITKGAVSLGLMGSNEGLPSLVLLATQVESPDSPVAFRTIYTLTGRNYNVSENTSRARHRERVVQLKEWFESGGKDQPVYRLDVLRRMNTPPAPEPLDPASLRGALRASRDITSYDRRWTARNTLREITPNRFEELETIARDPLEDLDIRRAAMSWLAAVDPKEARKTIRRLADDENPIIAETSEVLDREIREALAAN